ncbi:MAG: chemotaxis response regulator protein-glutamate methylesterase [Tepidanaerobacteraceae bacterium]|jgi:two-component system chemotaxis response regulator CheB|nr:chemotaxis response regulator protein-glutamate methylesterase [Tepidanaerobacteraceae bacterium]
MVEKIRVMVVDDSAFMRKFISDMINAENDMEVVFSARDGIEAVEKAPTVKPDVITMDVEMPRKNGLEALKELMASEECFQVIMLSGMTTQGSSITMEALSLGAFDFVQKPSGFTYFKIDNIKNELVEKIRYAWQRGKKLKERKGNRSCLKARRQEKYDAGGSRTKDAAVLSTKYDERTASDAETLKLTKKIEALALGASTGGPKVLYDVITVLPRDINMPVFVVQHMPAGFTKAFAERLDLNSFLTVAEAVDGEPIIPGRVYIAPGGYHMTVDGSQIKLDTSPPIHGVRPAVDKLFISAAQRYNDALLCCIFTGMGRDGAAGVKEVKSRGGTVIAQDEATSVVYGMPKAAYDTGCVDMVLPDFRVAEEIIKLIRKAGR